MLAAFVRYLFWAVRARPRDSRGRVTVGDASLFFRRYGSGEPVVLLHGGFGFAEMWAGQVPALASRYLVAAVDTRGHGRSTLGEGSLTYRGLASDFAGLIDELGLGPAHLVGWSDGGCAAIALALQRPELVRSMVLTGTPYSTENYCDNARDLIGRFLRPGSPTVLGCRALHRLMNPEPGRWREFLDKMRAMWTGLPDFTVEELSRITAPTLVVGCDRDEFLSVAGDPLRVFRQTAEAIPGARMSVIKGGTHSALIEKAGAFNELLLGFLQEVPGS